MDSLTLFCFLLLTLVSQALCAPVNGGQVATRDALGENSAKQVRFNFEKQLEQKALQTPVQDNKELSNNVQNLQTLSNTEHPTAAPSGEQITGGDLSREGSSEAVHLDSHDSEEASSDSSANEKQNQDIVQSDGGPSEEPQSLDPNDDISEEEAEILRTVIMTLRDNPQLIKILLENEEEEMQDFSKQKAQVSNPDFDVLWENFQDPSPQIQHRPKQVVKKAGQNTDGVVELPVSSGNPNRDGIHETADNHKADKVGALAEDKDIENPKPLSIQGGEILESSAHPTGKTIVGDNPTLTKSAEAGGQDERTIGESHERSSNPDDHTKIQHDSRTQDRQIVEGDLSLAKSPAPEENQTGTRTVNQQELDETPQEASPAQAQKENLSRGPALARPGDKDVDEKELKALSMIRKLERLETGEWKGSLE